MRGGGAPAEVLFPIGWDYFNLRIAVAMFLLPFSISDAIIIIFGFYHLILSIAYDFQPPIHTTKNPFSGFKHSERERILLRCARGGGGLLFEGEGKGNREKKTAPSFSIPQNVYRNLTVG